MDHDEEELGELLRLLGPVPAGWVEAAAALPAARRAIAEIGPRLLEAAADRALETAELEAALREAGIESTPGLAEAIRRDLQREA